MEQLVRQIGEERLFQEGKHWQELEDGSLIVSFKQWSRPHRHKLGVLLKIKLFFLCILSYFFGREKVFCKFSRWFSRYTCIPTPDTQEEFSESQTLCGRGGCHGGKSVVGVFLWLPWRPVVDSIIPMQRAQFQPLVLELRFHLHRGMAKKQTNKKRIIFCSC